MKGKDISKRLLRDLLKQREIICMWKRKISNSTKQNDFYISDRRHSTALNAEVKESAVKKTSLYDLHLHHGGKMVTFAGYSLPIQYESLSIMSSHLHTRSHCSLFDVSHMLQTRITGEYAMDLIESLCVTDVKGMKNGQSSLSLFTNSDGGIEDDFIITKVKNTELYLVSNASRQDTDKALLMEALDNFNDAAKHEVSIEFFDSDHLSLIAVQGPKSSNIVNNYTNISAEKLYFMTSCLTTFCGVENCRITRCGYTGEDGFEISVPSNKVTYVVELLLQSGDIKLAGLGARDSLRLEAGLCLYGSDINGTITPVEAGLTWTISKKRREERNFPGASIIMQQIRAGVQRRRIPIVQTGGPPARSGCKIVGYDNDVIGYVTSGCPSPTLGYNIAMGYVPFEYSKINTNLRVEVRNKLYDATISKTPFVSSKYYLKPK